MAAIIIAHITKPYAFRKNQLQKLKSAIASYEKEIAAALYSDLKKNEEESYATETGLVLAEITGALKNLRTFVFVPKKNHLRKTSTLPFN